MKKMLCSTIIALSAVSFTACKKSLQGLDGTWLYKPAENIRSTLVVSASDKNSFNFYLESEQKEIFRKIEGKAVFENDFAVFKQGKEGFEIKFSFKKIKDKVSGIALKGVNDGAFFDGEYSFGSTSTEKPQKIFKIIDGFYYKPSPDKKVTLDIMLEKGVMRERTLENGEVMGGRDLGSFKFVMNDIIVSVEDPAAGKVKEEIWKAVDDNTIKGPDGTEYSFYMP